MTQKYGFEIGSVIGFLLIIGAIFYTNPSPSIDPVIAQQNLQFLSNLIRGITIVSLVLTPIVVYRPTFTNTFRRGLLVGIPWAFGITGLISEIARIVD